MKSIIPYHGVCLLSDKAWVDSLRAASTHCLYSTTDSLLLAGKTKSILKPRLLESVCACVDVCVPAYVHVHACRCFMHTLGCAKINRPCWHLHKSTFCLSVNLPFTEPQDTFNENTSQGDRSHIDGSASRFSWVIHQSPEGSYRQSIHSLATLTWLGCNK